MTHYITIDIETVPTEIDPDWLADKEAKIREEYVKEETILKYLSKAKKDWRWEPAGSRPICIGMHSSLHKETVAVTSDDSKECVALFAAQLVRWVSKEQAHQVKFVGFNLMSFDLIRIHTWLSKANIMLIKPLGRYDVIDLIKWPYGYDVGKKSLNSYLKAFGIPVKSGDGADVEANWLADLTDGGTRVSDYCKADVEATYALFKKFCLMWQP